MLSALAETEPILTTAVAPTETATAARMTTDVPIFTRTGRSANQPSRRGVAGVGAGEVTSNRPGARVGVTRLWGHGNCCQSTDAPEGRVPMVLPIVMCRHGHRS